MDNDNHLSMPSLCKKILSVVLAVILGLGTLVTLTAGSFMLSDVIDIRNVFAAESTSSLSLPLFYRHGQLVGLYKLNYSDDTVIQYKIGDDGEWTDYSVPFSIPAYKTTKVYARIGENGTATYLYLSDTDEAIGVYTESNTDFDFSYNNIDFGYTRTYSSYTKDWFESIHSKVIVTESRLEVYLPDGSHYPMIRKDSDTYIDELNGYELTKTDSDYIFDDGQYKYYFSYNILSTIAYLSAIEDYSGNRLDLTRTTNTEEISISDGAGRTFYLSDFSIVDTPDSSSALYYTKKEITDPNGNKLEYTTKNGRYINITDQAGVTIGEYEYGNDLIDYTLIKSGDKTISYTDDGRVEQITYDNGSWIKYTYDDDNMLYTTLTSDGETTKTVYNDAFYTTEYTDESGITTKYTYDDHYRVQTTQCEGETTTCTYDDKGNITSYLTDNLEDNSYSVYDSDNHLVYKQDGKEYSYYTYDDNGNNIIYAVLKDEYADNPPTEYDESLDCFDVTSYTYNSCGKILNMTDPDGNITEYEYDDAGDILVKTEIQNDDEKTTTVTKYTYDGLGNMLSSQCGDESSAYIYDGAGRTILAYENGEYTRTLYDDLGRKIQEISNDDYDASLDGLPDENTYADATAGGTYEYDDKGNLISETNRLGVATTYEYDDVGNKIKEVFDIYEFTYDIYGNLINVNVSDKTKIKYEYDDNFNLTAEIYANGDIIRYKYDDYNNLIAQYHDNESEAYVTYSYDDENNLIGKINYDTGLEYIYSDDLTEVYNINTGELVQSYSSDETSDVDSDDYTGEYTTETGTNYGASYTKTSAELSQGLLEYSVVKYEYTANSDNVEYVRARNITNDAVLELCGYNNVASIAYSPKYDDDLVVSRTVAFNGSLNANTTDILYEYDSDDKITAEGYDEKNKFYTYDDIDQLIRVDNCYADNQYTNTYTYDERGNITEKNTYKYTRDEDISQSPIETTTFTYAGSEWSDLLTGVNGTELTYDASGNVLSYGDRTYTWNTGRNLESISEGDKTYCYTYDENGIRTSKTVSGTTTYYNTQEGVITYQTDGENTLCFQYDTSGVPFGFTYNGTQYFYVTDQMANVIGITDSSGEVFAEYVYDEWGKLITIYTADETKEEYAIANANPLRYRGYYYDNESGYYYLQSRYYDPSIGRFINVDYGKSSYTEVPLGTNLFIYCCNNPINNEDSTGKCWWSSSTVVGHDSWEGSSKYVVKKVMEYIEKYAKGRNSSFYNYSEDCANYVSQCLYAGGIQMSKNWYSFWKSKDPKKGEKWTKKGSKYYLVAANWRLADSLYRYYKNSNFCKKVYKLGSWSSISSSISEKKIKAGDLLFFDFDGDGTIDHATVVKSVSTNDLKYSAHTTDEEGRSLKSRYKSGNKVYIVSMKTN